MSRSSSLQLSLDFVKVVPVMTTSISLTEAIQNAFTRGPNSHLPVAFLDLQKAFDSVWHDGLLYKLRANMLIFLPRLILWIQSFLSNRQIRVVQSGHTSRLAFHHCWCTTRQCIGSSPLPYLHQ